MSTIRVTKETVQVENLRTNLKVFKGRKRSNAIAKKERRGNAVVEILLTKTVLPKSFPDQREILLVAILQHLLQTVIVQIFLHA